jgi:translation initiation factor 5A
VVVGNDIFTDKKYEDMCPTSHNMYVPNVDRNELLIIDITPDNFVVLMLEDGTTKEDLKIEDRELLDQIKDEFAAEKEVMVTVISAMGQEKIISYRINTNV